MDGSDGYCCFICLEDTPPLIRPCACRCLCCHQSCLARWQLQSAGKEEESRCRFCKQTLPSWKATFSECTGVAVPVMSIQYNGQVYWLEATPGDEGVKKFKENVRRLLGLGQEQSFDITFECRVPGADHSKMELHGLHTYDAAVYCASLTAARRLSHSGNGRSTDKPSSAWPSSSSNNNNSRCSTDTSSSSRASSSGSSTLYRSSRESTAAAAAGHGSSSSSGSSTNALTHCSTSSSSRRSSSSSNVDIEINSTSATSAATAQRVAALYSPALLPSCTNMLKTVVAQVMGHFRLLWQLPDDLDEFC